MKVYLDELPWDIRSRNTDWRYVRFALPQLARFEPSLQLVQQHSPRLTIIGNAKTLRTAIGRRVGFAPTMLQLETNKLSATELALSGADVVFSHGGFPLNAGQTPVVWQRSILDPAMQRFYGVTEATLSEEIHIKGPLFARAKLIQVSTDAEASRLAQTFPALADRFVPVPFFTPDLQPCDVALLDRHESPSRIRILFAGNHALRKGLDLLFEAFLSLPADIQSRAELTVLSNFDRSPMQLPQYDRISIVRGADSTHVLAEMQRSHILVNLARFESYGLVFPEAMSQGLACIGPDWEVQRELLDNGAAGRNLPCDVVALRACLSELITDHAARHALALAGWTRFRERYAPAIVARQYAKLFERAAVLGTSPAKPR